MCVGGCLFLSKPLSFKNVEPEYQKNLAVSKPDCVEKCLFVAVYESVFSKFMECTLNTESANV